MSFAVLNVALFFEVMDKEWPLWLVVVVFVSLGFAGFFLCRWKGWAGLLVLPLTLFVAWGQLDEVWDPQVGPAILKEAGSGYVILSYVFIALAAVLPLVGLGMNQWRRVRG